MTQTRTLSVAIDGRALVGERTGIGVHTAEIAGRLGVSPPPLIASHVEIGSREGIEHCRFVVDRSLNGVTWQQTRFASVAGGHGADVVWGPHGTLPLALRIPAVVSMHDLTSITMPQRHRLRTVLSFNTFIGRSLAMARRVAAVSHATADELMRWFAVPAGRIEIVPNGVGAFFSPTIDARDDEVFARNGIRRGEYLLFAGTFEPRKGLADLLDAWGSLDATRPPLVITGSSGWGARKVRRRLDQLRSQGGVIETGWVSRDDLRALYRGALAFVFPSRHEGFGLPVLEAMACGTPVVTTRAGALGEVAGGAAVFAEAGDPADLRGAIARVVGDAGLRAELATRGVARAGLFRWERSAELMAALLEAAAGSAE